MTTAKKSNHQVNIVRITEVLPHNNADRLEIIKIGGYQVVSQKGTFKVGDLGVYIQPDSVVPQTEPFRFIWEPYTENGSQVPERRRRITVKKLRGEWSEGLLMPIEDFFPVAGGIGPLHPDGSEIIEGDDVSELIGVTHYDPDAGVEDTRGEREFAPRRKYPKTLKGWFFFVLRKLGLRGHKNINEGLSLNVPTYDVDAFKNHTRAFIPGEPVVVTEKIHGSNARFVYFEGKMYAGSRHFWKSPDSKCIWRKVLREHTWIEQWCRRNPGYVLYGEVTPTQKGFDYGHYGTGNIKFFVFDILTPEGEWVEYEDYIKYDFDVEGFDGRMVPVLAYNIPFDIEAIKKYVDGPSTVSGARHPREGVVIKPLKNRHQYGVGRLSLKIVSNSFLEKDSKVTA